VLLEEYALKRKRNRRDTKYYNQPWGQHQTYVATKKTYIAVAIPILKNVLGIQVGNLFCWEYLYSFLENKEYFVI